MIYAKSEGTSPQLGNVKDFRLRSHEWHVRFALHLQQPSISSLRCFNVTTYKPGYRMLSTTDNRLMGNSARSQKAFLPLLKQRSRLKKYRQLIWGSFGVGIEQQIRVDMISTIGNNLVGLPIVAPSADILL